MSRVLLRRLVAASAVVAALAVASLTPASAQDGGGATTTTTPAGKGGAPVTPSGDPAIDDLVGCVQGSRQLLVLFLIDESASLKATDPDDRRVDAARGALDSLIALSSSTGSSSPKVDVSLAAFSNEYRTVQDWTPAGPDTAGELNDSLDEFADFNRGIDTDFVNALTAGRDALADQAAVITNGGGEAPCRAIMLFTDGGYDLAVRTSAKDQERLGTTKPYAPGVELTSKEQVEKAEALGRQALCDPGGVADQLRGDDITLLTVALSGDVARRSQLPLAAASAGKADDYPCGTQPGKGEKARPQGAYLPAEDIDVLITQFSGIGTRLAGGSLVPGSSQVKICDEGTCDDGTRTFTLDATLRRAQIVALPPAGGAAVTIEAPDGTKAEVTKAGTSKVGEVEIRARAIAGRGFAIDLIRPATADAWAGEWKTAIADPDQAGDAAILQVYVFSDIGVVFKQVPVLERGTEREFQVQLKLPKGVKAADVIDQVEATVRLRNPITGAVSEVPLEGSGAGPYKGTYATPADTTTNVLDATAEAKITTTADSALVSQSAPEEVLVRRPKGSIQFVPGSVQMPSLTGEGSTTGELLVLGGDAPGCVWFGKAAVPNPPEGAGPLAVTLADGKALPGEGNCLKVAKGESVTLEVEVTPAGRGSGTVAGTLTVFEKVEGAQKASTTEVPFRFDMARGVDQARRLLLSLLLLVAGLGLPLVVLIIINAIGARFQDLDAVRGAAVPVRVVGSSISRSDGAYARVFALRAEDFGPLPESTSVRRFTFGGVEFRAIGSRSPFGSTIALAAPEGGAEKLKGGAGSRVELDPGLAGSWIFLLDSNRTRAAGRGEVVGLLLAFAAEGDVAAQASRMLPDIEARLPDTAARLAGLVRSLPAKSKKRAKAGRGTDADTSTEADAAETTDPPADAPPSDEHPAAEPAAEVPADPAPPATDATPDEPGPAAAPAGFSGRAPAALPPTPSPTSDPDDEPPPSAPTGFGGRRPD